MAVSSQQTPECCAGDAGAKNGDFQRGDSCGKDLGKVRKKVWYYGYRTREDYPESSDRCGFS